METTKKQKWSLAAVSIPVMLWTLVPMFWIFSLSVKPQSIQADNQYFPRELSWENYQLILTGGASDLFNPALRNSIIVCLIATIISVVLATFCAYAIARLNFPG